MRRAGTLLLLLNACSPGVGRPVMFPDAGEPKDEGVVDSGPAPVDLGDPDFGPSDIALFDRGLPPPAPFTGAFAILNSNDVLFAREFEGQLQLIVANFPYTYEGNIRSDGRVDTESLTLERAGCPDARIFGTYERSGATFVMNHRTCGENGSYLESEIRGAFLSDYSADVSGIYAVDQRLDSDVFGCAPKVQGEFRWAFNALGDGAAAVFIARDLAPPQTYVGQLRNQRRVYSGTYRASAQNDARTASLEGQFEQLTANDPLVFRGTRQVYLPDSDCLFSVTFTATRTASL